MNFTPFPCSEAFLRNAAGELRRLLVLRQTFVGSTGAVAGVQERLELGDRYSDRGAMVVASDMVIERTGTTVLVRGPIVGDDPSATEVMATVRVGALEQRLVAFPRRTWVPSGGGYAIRVEGAYEPVTPSFENAFGGDDFDHNPVGMGLFNTAGGKTAAGIALPLVESGGERIASPTDRPVAGALALVAPGWRPRKSFAGTYDEAWKTSRAPLFAPDYDPRFADPGSVVVRPHVSGGERIELLNLGLPGHYVASVPYPTVRIRIGEGEHTPVIDTLHIDPAADTISLSLRLNLPAERSIMQAAPYLVRALQYLPHGAGP